MNQPEAVISIPEAEAQKLVEVRALIAQLQAEVVQSKTQWQKEEANVREYTARRMAAENELAIVESGLDVVKGKLLVAQEELHDAISRTEADKLVLAELRKEQVTLLEKNDASRKELEMQKSVWIKDLAELESEKTILLKAQTAHNERVAKLQAALE